MVDYCEVFGQRQRQFTAMEGRGPLLGRPKFEGASQAQSDDVVSISASVDAVEFGFDLSKICFHYKHRCHSILNNHYSVLTSSRMTLRNEAPVFVFGDVMSLQVKDEADSAVPHVVAFARVWRLPDTHDKVILSQHASWSVQEQDARAGPDLCIVATSFSHRVENFYVDLGRLKPWFGSSGDVRKVYQVRETIDSPQLDVTVSWLELQV